MAEALICPQCGLPCPGSHDEATAIPPDQPTCNPLRSPKCWRVVGKATKRHPVTGNRNLLRLINSVDHKQGEEAG